MKNVVMFLLFLAAFAFPVRATGVGGVSDAILVDNLATEFQVEEVEVGSSPRAGGDSLSGGYYFVVDCALGNSLKFYVPLEWSHDVFTLNSSGGLVNLSNNTCYAYCPAYPDYTFSCSRFGTFTYRATNYNTTDLMITNISDSNIEFLEDDTQLPSDSDLLLLIAGLVFVFGACGLILRRR